MKDLRSRWHALALIFALGTMVGCATLQGGPAQNSGNNSLVVITPQLDFGTVVVGRSKTLGAIVQNRTAFGIRVNQAATSSPEFQIVSPKLPFSIRPGQSVSFQVQFTPQSAGAPSSTVSLSSTAPQPSSTFMLSGQAVNAGQLTPSAASISFGSVAVGQSISKPETFTNSGSTSLTVSQLTISGADFQLSGVTVPFTLDPGQTQSFAVTYAPKAAGTSSGSIAINSNVAMTAASRGRVHAHDVQAESSTIPLSGTATGSGTGQLTANPSSVSFGTVQVNGNSSATVVLQNPGSASVTISQATATGTGFTMSGLNVPATIAAGQSASFSVNFAPKTAGSASGNVAITSNASIPLLNVALSGTAVTPGSLTSGSGIIAFGTVQVGSNQKQSATITNSGGSSVTINTASITGTGFTLSGITTPLTLAAGTSTTFSVTFAPQTAANAAGTVTVASTAPGSPLTWTLSGTGVTAGALTANPASLSFGTVQTGSNKSLLETLTNSGGTTVTVSQVAASGTYSVTGLTLPLTLTAGQSTTFNVLFAPTAGGAANTTLTVTSDASNPSLGIPLSGTGATPGSLAAGTSPLSFGSVTVGSSQTLSETLTNSGGSTVTVSQATATGAGFSVSGLTLPLTLAGGASKSFSVVFAPATTGNASGNLAITSDASNPSLGIPLSGTGLAAGSLTAGTSPLSFGSVTVGSSQTLSETLTNSGGSTVTVSQATATGAGFSVSGITLPLTLTAGASKSFSVVFTPAAAGNASGNLTVTSDASNPSLAIPLSGTGLAAGSLTAGTSSLSFGNVTVGNSQTLSETLTNSGGSTVTVSQATATGAGFSVTGLTLPLTLTAGASKSFSVVFTPAAAGNASGSLTVTSDASNPSLAIPLSGTGATPGSLTAGTSPLSFGSVTVGKNQTLSETLINSGGSTVTVSQATATGAGFSVSGLTLPLTLAAGASKSFSVVFTPTAAGNASGTLTITSDASNPSLGIPLSGTGATPGALSAGTSPLSFGSVTVGNSQTLSETLTNSGGYTVTVSQATATGAGFSVSGLTLPLTLTSGASKSFSVVLTPAAAGNASGTLTITSDASNPSLGIPLSGTGVATGTISASPANLSFGSVQVGSSSTQSATLTNTGGSTVNVSQVNVTGTGFGKSGLTLPLALAAGQSFTFNVTFTPSSAGAASGSIAIVSDASNTPPAISLSGTGTAVGQFGVSPTSFGFGSVTVGSTKNMTATLTATGASVSVSSASVSSSEFTLTGPALPLTIAAGQTATFTLAFTPQASGAASGTVTFVTNASGSPSVEALSGTGTAPPQHRVDLNWSPSTSSVAGYNVYRSVTSGSGYAKLNSSLSVSTVYTDNSVTAGSTYFYVTTAVDSSGSESSFSNQVQAVIPTP